MDPPGAKHGNGEDPQPTKAGAAEHNNGAVVNSHSNTANSEATAVATAVGALDSPKQKQQLPPSNTKHVAKKIKTKHMDPAVLQARRGIQKCCATNDFGTALQVYREALASETRIEAATFYSLLNLCDGLDRKVHVGTPKPTTLNTTTATNATATATNITATNMDGSQEQEQSATTANNGNATSSVRPVSLETRKQAAFEIKERMDMLKIPLNETAYTALVKILTRANELEAASLTIKEAEGVQQCRVKLRLYSPLLQAYCSKGELLKALQLWERIAQQQQQDQPELFLTEREYASIVECCALHGGDASVVKKIFTDLSEEVLVPSNETCDILVKWFESSFAVEHQEATTTADAKSSLLCNIKLPSSQGGEDKPLGPVQCPPNHTWAITPGCRVDTKTGALLDGCLHDEVVQPIQLSTAAWQEMLNLNETIVLSGKLDKDASAFQGGKKGKKRKLDTTDHENRANIWKRFQSFLEHKCYDVIIDGANVGYYQQNFGGAPRHVDYRQIDSVVQHFLRLGKKVLLVMHQRHFHHNLMPARFRPLLDWWKREGILFQTPSGMNDDWFWMHAALQLGPGTLVLTNDEMRDHHFQMLSPRSFLRWKDRHQVHFSFGVGAPPINGGNYNEDAGRPVVLTYPELYSRRIQRVANGYAIPHPKRGDENRFLDGTHIADEDTPVEETYLCIRPMPVSYPIPR